MDSIKKEQRILGVVPTFNRISMLRECVDSMIVQSVRIEKILIVNSGPPEDMAELLKVYSDRLVIIDVDEKNWWADCMNIGISHALREGADYILAMNDDTFLDSKALGCLLETAAEYPGCIIGSIVKDRNDSERLINDGVGSRYTKYRWLPYKKIVGNVQGRDIYYTEGHSGRGVLFPASVYQTVGLYDVERFPHRGDRDFSLRCFKAGVGQFYDSAATVYLNFSTSYLDVEGKRLSIKDIKNVLFHINGLYYLKYQYLFLQKHYAFSWPFWYLIWVCYVLSICTVRFIPKGSCVLRRFSQLLSQLNRLK
jgi:GT2 family glycosyltransferase